ncbi:MAG: SEC-C domain-containing protein [Planctomycetes bacterium]|nr:SEC-C domain-containing protein [Planctomycetota bacterium]
METLERIWENTGLFFNSVLGGFERGVTAMFGSANARTVRNLQSRVDAIRELEPRFEAMSEAELREQTDIFKKRLAEGETLDDLLVEAFAAVREAGKRFLDMRHYDVQMIGGMVLHSGAIAEMVTGEGKTLVATLPAYLNALEGKGVHVVTVNDYLARRDMEWMGPLYMGLGLTVGAIQSDMPVGERQKAYSCDITYGTNNEFGFDYLRDNMRPAARNDNRFPKQYQQSQGPLHFAIVDEVDNILIDEARTPLIISGPAFDNPQKYSDADKIARALKEGIHIEVKEKEHSAHLTDEGVREAERLAGVESFYTAGNMDWPHLIDNSLKAHYLYKLDVNYVVEQGKVVIIDEFTGRKMEGRQWSDGLHQAVEAKEGVKIKEETQTLATITLQNFFKLYDKICGMTGTAMTEAGEFWKIYKLDVVAIPTNRPMRRLEHSDVIYQSEREKYNAVAEEIEQMNKWDVVLLKSGEEVWGDITKESEDEVTLALPEKKGKRTFPQSQIKAIERQGRPVLVGTVSIEKSERLSKLLNQRGIKHEVLNAKYHKREAEIVAQAGRLGAVTIATNMAGRGTDIVLGGNAETMTWALLQDKYATRLDVPREEWDALVEEIETRENMKEQGEQVKQLGGLHVIGTERHESRRIDLQLRGRCGRQGDPGSSRFFLSLEDDLMRIFIGKDWVRNILQRLGMQEGESIESRLVTRRIEAAQKKVEERNFEIRKNLLEYDEVMDFQRKKVYGYRQQILDGADCKALILEMIAEQVETDVTRFLNPLYGCDTFAKWAAAQVHMSRPLEARMFRGADISDAETTVRDEALREAESDIFEKMEENLPNEEEAMDEWNWEAMARFANARWGTNYRDRDLKKIGRDQLAETLLNDAEKFIEKQDLSEGAEFLQEDYGVRTTVAWAELRYGVKVDLEEAKKLEPPELKRRIVDTARQAYEEKEAEYPIMAGIYRFSVPGGGGQRRLDRESLIAWAADRFHCRLDIEEFKNKQRDEIRAALLKHSRENVKQAGEKLRVVREKVATLFDGAEPGQTLAQTAAGNGSLTSLDAWLKTNFEEDAPSAQELSPLAAEEVERRLCDLVHERFRPEMRRMERQVLLQLVDTAWKDHLLAMDHLRSSIGLVGYAQLDAKVEFKREGMKMFDDMWGSVADRVTELVYRMEQLDEGFVSSTWVETAAVHAQAPGASEIAQQQQAGIDASQGDGKLEPIRNRGQKVGRNDPCWCGSGKKYKNCHLRKDKEQAA